MPHDPSSPVPDDAKTAIILAHEAGTATDTKWMDTLWSAIARALLTVSGLPGRQHILRPNRAGKARVTA